MVVARHERETMNRLTGNRLFSFSQFVVLSSQRRLLLKEVVEFLSQVVGQGDLAAIELHNQIGGLVYISLLFVGVRLLHAELVYAPDPMIVAFEILLGQPVVFAD